MKGYTSFVWQTEEGIISKLMVFFLPLTLRGAFTFCSYYGTFIILTSQTHTGGLKTQACYFAMLTHAQLIFLLLQSDH